MIMDRITDKVTQKGHNFADPAIIASTDTITTNIIHFSLVISFIYLTFTSGPGGTPTRNLLLRTESLYALSYQAKEPLRALH